MIVFYFFIFYFKCFLFVCFITYSFIEIILIFDLEQAGFLLLASLLWGGTNPFMKRGSKGISTIKKYDNTILQILYEFWFLFTRPQVHIY